MGIETRFKVKELDKIERAEHEIKGDARAQADYDSVGGSDY